MNIGQDILDRNVQSLETGDEIQPVGQVIINYGTDENGITLSKAYPLPAETGRVLELTIETITDGDEVEEMAENIYNRYHKVVGGVTYDDVHEAFSVSGTELSPLMELGDGVTVNYTSYSDIGNLTTDFTKAMYADIESQGIPEEDDFPYLSNLSNKTEKELKTVKASLRVTATEIRSEVSGWTGITATAWSSTTTYAQGDTCYRNGVYYKSLQDSNINHQPPNNQWWTVYNEQSYVESSISTSIKGINLEYSSVTSAPEYSSSTTYVKGAIVKYSNKYYQALQTTTGHTPSSSSEYWEEVSATNSAYVRINGEGVQIGGATINMSNVVADSVSASNVTAGTLNSDVIYSGTISMSNVLCQGNAINIKDSTGQIPYGTLGYGSGNDGVSSTYGITLKADANHYLICTSAGVRMQSGSNSIWVTDSGTSTGQAVFG